MAKKPLTFEEIMAAMEELGVDDPELIPDVYGDLEAWMPCPNHPGYEVSEFGRVRNADGKILSPERQGRHKLPDKQGNRSWVSIFDLLDQTFRKDEPEHVKRLIRSMRERGAISGPDHPQ